MGWASRHARRFGTAVLNSGRWAEVDARGATRTSAAQGLAAATGRDPLGGDYPNNFTGDNVRRVLGLEPGDLAQSSFFDRIHPDDRSRATLELEMLLARGRSVQEYRFLHGDGTYHWILDENLVIDEPGDLPARIVGFLADVTDLHEVSDERVLLAAVMDQTTDAILLCDLDGSISFANAALCEMTGRTTGELVGMHTSALANDETLKPLYAASMAAGFSGQRWTGTIAVNWSGDRSYDLDVAVWPLMIEDKVSSLVVILRDVTNEHQLSASLQRQAEERTAVADALARIRRGGSPEEVAAAGVQELTALDGIDVALVLGFPSGPGISRLAADGAFMGRDPWLLTDGCGEYLRRQLEAGRTLEDWNDHRQAHHQMSCSWGQTGLQALQLEPLAFDGVVVGGILVGSMMPNGRARLLELAPLLAEYGSMIAALLGPEVTKRREVGDVRARIERVLADHAFHSVFQPVFDMNARRVVGYEALTRFDDGTRPDLQFALAVAAELGPELEAATLAGAMAAGAALPEDCWISLNASPELILEHDVLAGLLANRGDRLIVLEVTEHAVVDDYAALRRAVADIGGGVRIAVDDAGAGFASLRHVIELRPDFVKLDIGLIRGVDEDDARQALVAGMVHFATESGCTLVAEGIETESELEALRRLGLHLGQGYLLGRPASAATLSA
jgi:PAS domain S-box-containing protein